MILQELGDTQNVLEERSAEKEVLKIELDNTLTEFQNIKGELDMCRRIEAGDQTSLGLVFSDKEKDKDNLPVKLVYSDASDHSTEWEMILERLLLAEQDIESVRKEKEIVSNKLLDAEDTTQAITKEMEELKGRLHVYEREKDAASKDLSDAHTVVQAVVKEKELLAIQFNEAKKSIGRNWISSYRYIMGPSNHLP